METIFFHYLNQLNFWSYVIIFIGMVFEGEIILFMSFYLAHQGYLKLSYVIPIVVFGVILGDIIWYKSGAYLERKIPFVRRWLGKISKPLDKRLIKNPFATLFISKFAYGAYHATLIRAGAVKVPLKDFLKTDIISSLVWIGFIGGIGYFSSVSLSIFKKELRFAELGLLLAIIFFVLVRYFISKISSKELKGDFKNNNINK